MIENDSIGWATRTWTASCRGRRYFCSAVQTGSGKDYSNSQINCAPEQKGAEPASASAGGDSPQPTNTVSSESSSPAADSTAAARVGGVAPAGVAGFAFGASLEDTGKICTAAGKEWKAEEGYCSGTPTDVGIDASVRVRICGGKVCVIELAPEAKAGVGKTFLATKEALSKKYGAPRSGKRNVLPSDCTQSVAACLESGRAKLEFRWVWPTDESISLSIGKHSESDDTAAMHLRYSAPNRVRVNANGL